MSRSCLVLLTALVFIARQPDGVAGAKFTCNEGGTFADPNDETGTRYYVCTQLVKGVFRRTRHVCPEGTSFSEATLSCVEGAAKKLRSVEDGSPETTTLTTDAVPEFVCTKRGRFADSSDKTCSSYFLCNLLANGTFVMTPYSCPLSTFDPVLHRCSVSYVCPWTTTTTEAPPPPTTTTTTTTEEALETTGDFNATAYPTTTDGSCSGTDDFACEQVGRFKNGADCTCQWYYLCNQLRNGTFIQTPYKCPKNSIFDPTIHMCSLLQQCSSVNLLQFREPQLSLMTY